MMNPEVFHGAIRLVRTGIAKARVARDLGIHLCVLKAWLRQFDQDPDNPFPGKGKMRPEEAELFRLKHELMKVTAERDILKNVWSAPWEQGPSSIPVASRFASMYPAY